VYDDPELDLEWVGMSERTREPLAVVTYPGRQAIRFFDAALEADLAVFRRHSPTGLRLLSFDDGERLVTVEVFTEKGYENHLVDLRTGETHLLGLSPLVPFAYPRGSTDPNTLI